MRLVLHPDPWTVVKSPREASVANFSQRFPSVSCHVSLSRAMRTLDVVTGVMCHVSCVMCHVSCHVSPSGAVRTLDVVAGVHGWRGREVLDASPRRQVSLRLLGRPQRRDEVLPLLPPVTLLLFLSRSLVNNFA